MDKVSFSDTRISLYPKPVVVVTAIGEGGDFGATTIAWTGIVSSRPPVMSVSFLPDSYTRGCITKFREFVINVPDSSLTRETNLLGSISGPWKHKAAVMQQELGAILTPEPSEHIRTPRLAECYINVECRLLSTVPVGLYDCFFGHVLCMHYGSKYLKIGGHPRGALNHNLVQPLLCLGDEYWSGGVSLGSSTENKDHPHGEQH